jgi:transposase
MRRTRGAKKEPTLKKNNTTDYTTKKPRHRKRSKRNPMNMYLSSAPPTQTVGIDLGDKTSRYHVVDQAGVTKQEGRTATTKKGMAETFAQMSRSRIALEVGTHSAWVSRLLASFGHEVIVANARRVRAISDNNSKDDRMDAQLLARLARVDPGLLYPIRHRGAQVQQHLATIRARAALVDGRTALINAARGLVKAFGERLAQCDADQMGEDKLKDLEAGEQAAVAGLLRSVAAMTEQIQEYDKQIAEIARKHYPETALLQQVHGVGQLIALTFILTLEDAERFERSRDVGCYVGLRPKRKESGESQPELNITKEGDVYLRRLLVQGAHCILSARAPDTDLKRWGLKLAGEGEKQAGEKASKSKKQKKSKKAKKRAVVAVARKLAILLHSLWVTGEVYERLRNSQAATAAVA